ncbi:hypothetical protein G6F31_020556 [Rhizopus arrhizus]|nr:hypothetical protein G6F31_020556 [Rhizopus arrhizus]
MASATAPAALERGAAGTAADDGAGARAQRDAGSWPDLRQARPGAGDPCRPAASGMDRRALRTAERSAGVAVRGHPRAARGRPWRVAHGGIRFP